MTAKGNHQMPVGINIEVTDNTGSIKKQTSDLNELNTALKGVSNVAKLLKTEYSTGLRSANDTLKALKDEISKTEKEITNLQNTLKTKNKDDSEYKKTQQQYSAQVNSLQQLKKAYDEVYSKQQKWLDALNTLRKKYDSEEDKRLLDQLAQRSKYDQKTYENAVNSAKQITKELEKNANEQLQITKKLNNEKIKDIRKTSEETKRLNSVMTGIVGGGDNGNSFFGSTIRMMAISQLTREFYKLGEIVSEVNYNTINNQRLLGNFSDTVRDKLIDNSVEIAKLTGITISNAQEIQGAWIRINQQYANSMELLNGITTLTSKFMNVGDIQDAEEAVKLINSSLLQFGLTSSNVNEQLAATEEMLNKWAYMADITAMGTAEEFGEAIRGFGSALVNVNGDMDDAIVMSSLLADNLAMNGQEIRTALKTFTQYLTRSKTTNLFNDLSEQLNDTSIQIVDVNGKFKEFDEIMNIVSSTYERLMASGNEQGAREIVEALGATRRADVATAMLKTWNDATNGAQKYYDLLESESSNNYLETQNEKLMNTLKNQWNTTVVAMQDLAIQLGNNGILDYVTMIVKGLGSIMESASNLSPILLKLASALMMSKVINMGVNAIKKYSNSLQTMMNIGKYGSKQTAQTVLSLQSHTESLISNTLAEMNNRRVRGESEYVLEEEYAILKANKIAYDELNRALLNNEITTKQYIQQMHVLNGCIANGTAYKKADTTTTQANTMAKQMNANANKQSFGSRMLNAVKTFFGVATNEQKKNTIATYAGAVAQKAMAVASGILEGALTLLKGAITMLLDPTALFTMAITIIPMLLGNVKSEASKTQEQIEKLGEALDEYETRLEELNNLKNQRGLTSGEQQELEFLQTEIALTEKQIALLKQKNLISRTFEYQSGDGFWGTIGGWFGLGGQESYEKQANILLSQLEIFNQQTIKNTLENLAEYQVRMKELQDIMDSEPKGSGNFANASAEYYDLQNKVAKDAQLLTDTYKEMLEKQVQAQTMLDEIKAGIENGTYIGSDLEKAKEIVATLETYLSLANPSLEQASEYLDEISTYLDNFDIEEVLQSIKEVRGYVDELNNSIDNFMSGNLSHDELFELASKYSEFGNVITGSYEEQLKALNNIHSQLFDDVLSTIDDNLQLLKDKAYELQQALDNSTAQNDTDKINEITQALAEVNSEISQLQLQKDISLSLEFSGLDDFISSLNSIVDGTENLYSAMTQLNSGVALTKNQLFELATQYEELLYAENLFATSSVDGQKQMLEQVMELKNAEYDATIDRMINELKARKEQHQVDLNIEQEKQNLLLKAKEDATKGYLKYEKNQLEVVNKYQQLEYKATVQKEQAENKVESQSANNIVKLTKTVTSKMVDFFNAQGKAKVDSANEANKKAYQSTTDTYKKESEAIVQETGVRIKTINNIMAGGVTNANAIRNNLLHNRTSYYVSPTMPYYNNVGAKIGGLEFDDWLDIELENVSVKIEDLSNSIKNYDVAIKNLEDLKNYNLNKLIQDAYKNEDANSSKNTSSNDKDNRETELANALKDIQDTVEKFYETYKDNVLDLQQSIVDALRTQYEQQRDDRIKELEEQRQTELDAVEELRKAIEGEDNTQSKESELEDLKRRYDAWTQDNSSVGLAKQKELLESIDELAKEIELDKLEQMEEEINNKYDNALDEDSDSYDEQLANLDKKLQEANLVTEASQLIATGQRDKIISLLNKFNPIIDGWAILMGKTIDQKTTEYVDSGLNNYLDLLKGTIGVNGGTYTNNNSTWDSNWFGSLDWNKYISNLTGSQNSASQDYINANKYGEYQYEKGNYKAYHTTVDGTTLGKLAQVYYNDTNKWTKIRDTNHLSSYTKDQKLVKGKILAIPFKTGGYTGNNEGLAYLHAKERVLTDTQTRAFDKLVYDFIPTLQKSFNGINGSGTKNNYTFNKPFVEVNVGEVNNNTNEDSKQMVENLNDVIKDTLQRYGMRQKI